MSEPVIAAKTPIAVDVESGKTYWWCACGQSKTQPFCDGSHRPTETGRGGGLRDDALTKSLGIPVSFP